MRQNAKQNNASNSTLESRHRSFCESLRYSTTTRQKSLRTALKQRLHSSRRMEGIHGACLDSGKYCWPTAKRSR